ncbi:PHF7 protein, partial [Pygoscelis papua]
ACMLCWGAEADPDICGRKLEKQGLCAHEFCLVSSSGAPSSFPTGCPCHALLISSSSFLFCSFLPMGCFSEGHCFVCGESGAAITCQKTGCDRSFHLPCAVEGGCNTQFFFQY